MLSVSIAAAWQSLISRQSALPCLLMHCRKCFEVQCVKKDFHDGYGQHLSRWFACKNEHKRVVVKITDR